MLCYCQYYQGGPVRAAEASNIVFDVWVTKGVLVRPQGLFEGCVLIQVHPAMWQCDWVVLVPGIAEKQPLTRIGKIT